jgi:hypothetical protein
MYIDNETFTLSGDTAISGIILKSSVDDSSIKPLRQGSNPIKVYITGEECTLSLDRNSGIYSLKRNSATGSRIIPQGTSVIPAHNYEADYTIIWVGTNNKWTTNEDFIYMVQRIVNYCRGKCVVVGIPQKENLDLRPLEKQMSRELGSKFINMREYLVTNAIYDAGITPTAQDLQDMSEGRPPVSLRSDVTHYNSVRQKVIAEHIYKRITQIINI